VSPAWASPNASNGPYKPATRTLDLDARTVELPGFKTDLAWRTAHLTSRGVAAIREMPRALKTRRVFHIDGRPISWVYFWREVWTPALELAGLEHRAPYNLRHSYALHSLQAGFRSRRWRADGPRRRVPHVHVDGGWVREMGSDAAALRERWATSEDERWSTGQSSE
jgi:hypothetical protein